jgi:hypothetical protein
MMLEFKINGALGSRKSDLFQLLFPRDLVNLGDILVDDLVLGVSASLNIYAPDGRSGSKILAQVRDGARANPGCAFHGTSGTSRRLGRDKGAISTSWCEGLTIDVPVCSRRRFLTSMDLPSLSSSIPRCRLR